MRTATKVLLVNAALQCALLLALLGCVLGGDDEDLGSLACQGLIAGIAAGGAGLVVRADRRHPPTPAPVPPAEPGHSASRSASGTRTCAAGTIPTPRQEANAAL